MVEGGGTTAGRLGEVVVVRRGNVPTVVVVDESVAGFVTTPDTGASAAE